MPVRGLAWLISALAVALAIVLTLQVSRGCRPAAGPGIRSGASADAASGNR